MVCVGLEDQNAGEGGEADAELDLDAILPVTVVAHDAPGRRGGVDRGALRACERFIELLIDLLSQFFTRRYLSAVVDERAVLVRARAAPLATHPAGTLFAQLLDQLAFYTTFPVDNHTGEAIDDLEIDRRADDAVLQFQRLLFARWPAMRAVALTNCASVRTRHKLAAALASLPLPDLVRMAATQLRLARAADCEALGADFTREVLLTHFASRASPRAAISAMPLYPTETLLWDEHQIPSVHYTGDAPLALPKINLQFLTFWDYLLRNFNLFRLEAAYEIREDVGDMLKVRR